MTADGHFYLDDLMQAWGKAERLEELEVLAALRSHAVRQVGDEIEQRFSILPTIKGRILIRVAPKNQTRRKIGPRDAMHFRFGAPHARLCKEDCKQEYKAEEKQEVPVIAARRAEPKAISTRDKLDMSLSQLIWHEHENVAVSSVRNTCVERLASPVGLAAPVETVVNGNSIRLHGSIVDQRFGKVRRSMQQMGLTPNTAHMRAKPCRKAAAKKCSEVVDSSPSPPRSHRATVAARESHTNPDDDAVDAALAARVSQCCKVSGEIEIRDASGGNADNEPPSKPPGGNWEQYFDNEHGDVWYYWPGPGGQWWCGCSEDDVPKAYNDGVDA